MRRRIPIVALLAGLALAAGPAASAAAPQAAFGLRAVGNPTTGYFVYSAQAGTTERGAVIVSNTGTAAGTVSLYTADATTGTTSGTVYLTDSAPTRTGAWISLGSRTLTLAPGKHASVSFTVHVPTGTATGEYVGGIVAEASETQPGTGSGGKTSVQIKIRNLSIMAVQVDIPGPVIHKFTIGQITTGGTNGFQQVIVRVSNQGNVFEKPKGVVTVYDAAGKAVETLDFSMDTFLPHTVIDYPIQLKKALAPGTYSAAVSLHYATAGAQTATAKPTFAVTRQDVAKVFTSASPTLAPPTVTTPVKKKPVVKKPATNPVTTTAPPRVTTTVVAAPPVASSSSTSRWLLVALGGIAVLLLALLVVLLVRRRGGPQASAPAAAAPTSPAPLPAVAVLPAVPAVAPVPAPVVESPLQAPSLPVGRVTPAVCDPYHYWDVRYDEPARGADGVWRFPHRCRNCGLELLARDVTDATQQVNARG